MQQLRLFFKASLSFEIMRPLQHLRDNLNLKREMIAFQQRIQRELLLENLFGGI